MCSKTPPKETNVNQLHGTGVLSLAPEKNQTTSGFGCFQGVKKENSGMKQVKQVKFTFKEIIKFTLTLYFTMLKNGQTYFKNLAVFTPQDF